MQLRFIGSDKSLGLRKGAVYKVKIYDSLNCIIVMWDTGLCPYSSPQSFAKNWEVA